MTCLCHFAYVYILSLTEQRLGLRSWVQVGIHKSWYFQLITVFRKDSSVILRAAWNIQSIVESFSTFFVLSNKQLKYQLKFRVWIFFAHIVSPSCSDDHNREGEHE